MSNNDLPTFRSNDRASRLREAKIIFKLNYGRVPYEISLPSGMYYLYAMTSEMPVVKAYYDGIIKSGVKIECKSKLPVAVKVKPANCQ